VQICSETVKVSSAALRWKMLAEKIDYSHKRKNQMEKDKTPWGAANQNQNQARSNS
jgi:hypothetical protein